jgi:hypothetical protein
LNVVDLDCGLWRDLWSLQIASRCMVVVVMVRCTLDVVMVVHGLTWAGLWKAVLSPVEWSGGIRMGSIVISFCMVMMVMVTGCVSMYSCVCALMDLLMVRSMMVVMARVIVLASLPTSASRGRTSSVVAVCVECVLVFDTLGLPALLRIHALQP